MSRLGVLLTAAFWEGLFLAVNYKTGHDVSPAGIGNTILTAFEPLIGEQSEGIVTIVKIILVILPWLSVFLVIEKFGLIKGGIIFVGVTIVSFILFSIMIV
jgi:hypothetical protein